MQLLRVQAPVPGDEEQQAMAQARNESQIVRPCCGNCSLVEAEGTEKVEGLEDAKNDAVPGIKGKRLRP